ncbi:hypothetical protein [Frondihabitans australicus]|uniref:Tetratricopeptide repeat protein n=1 Tax=Frondihabitans australicus TaxID=386892 RepID=A0A495IKE4_9MICO|nr:hypothetical protein [Frondihabitans australicus]RKR75585.1 hypothetical protein C8E83_2733 [Frondihabitans australicus]
MTEHDHSDDSAHGGLTDHPVPETLAAPIVPTGPLTAHFDPVSLRPAIDAAAIEGRLAELGASRSTAALGERADLLRMLGRLDDALAISEEAFRLAHFTGDRADSTAARIRRAYVFKEQGRLERALNDLHTSRISAATEEWSALEAAAAELEGYTLYDLGRYEESRESLGAALAAYEKSGAPAERTNGLRVAIEGVMRAILQKNSPDPVEDEPAVAPTGEAAAPSPAEVPSGAETLPEAPAVADPAPTLATAPDDFDAVVRPVVLDSPGYLGGESAAPQHAAPDASDEDDDDVIEAEAFLEGAGETSAPAAEDEPGHVDEVVVAEVEGDDDESDVEDTDPAPLFRTTGSPAFLGSPAERPAPQRLDPDAGARLDPDAPADEAIPDAASIGVETQAIAIPHATAPGRARRIIDDEDRNEDDDEQPSNGFDAEVNRARKAARSIWGAFDATNDDSPRDRS